MSAARDLGRRAALLHLKRAAATGASTSAATPAAGTSPSPGGAA
jgi:hypothetical protein